MSYSNFKDPIGLMKRMLFSNNKVAYSVIQRELLSKLLVPADFLMQRLEKRKIATIKEKSKQPIILILGGSRSGTTLLYQTLVQYLPVSYLNNLTASFQRSPISAFKLFKNIISKPKEKYTNYYGSVAGLSGPNDGFLLWNRWLGENRNQVPKSISHEAKSDMKQFFNVWLNVSKKPFINKNNRNSLCAPMFDAVFDNIYFVEIYRNPIYVAQSLILARRFVQGNQKIGWGLLSNDTTESEDPMAYIDDVCKQVFEVNEIIDQNRAKIHPKKYFRVSYEEFCQNPAALVQIIGLEALKTTIDAPGLATLQFSTSSNRQLLNDIEFKRIQNYFAKFNTKEKSFPNEMTF